MEEAAKRWGRSARADHRKSSGRRVCRVGRPAARDHSANELVADLSAGLPRSAPNRAAHDPQRLRAAAVDDLLDADDPLVGEVLDRVALEPQIHPVDLDVGLIEELADDRRQIEEAEAPIAAERQTGRCFGRYLNHLGGVPCHVRD
jgi:hypothetical protein